MARTRSRQPVSWVLHVHRCGGPDCQLLHRSPDEKDAMQIFNITCTDSWIEPRPSAAAPSAEMATLIAPRGCSIRLPFLCCCRHNARGVIHELGSVLRAWARPRCDSGNEIKVPGLVEQGIHSSQSTGLVNQRSANKNLRTRWLHKDPCLSPRESLTQRQQMAVHICKSPHWAVSACWSSGICHMPT